MLTRIYADNYRAFVNTELELGARTLLMGANGTGKSTFGSLLTDLRLLLFGQDKTDDVFAWHTLTRWQAVPQQRFELDVTGPQGNYRYKLVLEHRETATADQPRTRIQEEVLLLNENMLFQFKDGLVQLFGDDFSFGPKYPFDWGRSALGTISPRNDNKLLTWFVQWVRDLAILRPVPQLFTDLVESDNFFLLDNAENFAAWYHMASAADKRRDRELHRMLAEILPGFEALNFDVAGPNRWLLRAEFSESGRRLPLRFNELSEGQRSIILLYSLLVFVLNDGRTVFLDEPDNFIALSEIQPWLLAASDAVDDNQGQLIVASHHPEFFNQWSIGHGVVTERDGIGPVRVRPFSLPADTSLTPAETISRGWDKAG